MMATSFATPSLLRGTSSPGSHSDSVKDVMELLQGYAGSGTPGVSLTPPAGRPTVVCPGLSLLHPVERESSDRSFTQDRRQAEDYAAGLLRRTIRASPACDPPVIRPQDHPRHDSPVHLPDLPATLLRNLQDSFAVLLDCRLRAYASCWARSVTPATEPALAHLLAACGRTMTTVDATLAFVPQEDSLVETQYSEETQADFGFVLEVAFAVQACVGPADEDRRSVAVHMAAPGYAMGAGGADADAPVVTLHVSVKELLPQMIAQASLVVSAMVDFIHTTSVTPEPPAVARSSSYLLMPPPPPTKKTDPTASMTGLEMLSQAAEDFTSGSNGLAPVHRHTTTDPAGTIVSDDEDQVLLQHLSPEQCASIVDGVFGELDDDFCLGPPAKRFKTKQPVRWNNHHHHDDDDDDDTDH